MLLRDNSTTLDLRTDLLIEYDDRSRGGFEACFMKKVPLIEGV